LCRVESVLIAESGEVGSQNVKLWTSLIAMNITEQNFIRSTVYCCR